MSTFAEMVAAVGEQGGFDVSETMRGDWINEVYRKAVARSQWVMSSLELGPTVADQGVYALPDAVADLAGLFVQRSSADSPVTYDRTSTDLLWSVKAGSSRLSGTGGVFAPAFSSAGVAQIELWPPPDASGASITALAAMIPTSLTGDAVPSIPEDMHGDLVDGAIALGLLRIDERPDSAAMFEQRFETMVAELRRRKNSRVGSGTARMKVKGHDW